MVGRTRAWMTGALIVSFVAVQVPLFAETGQERAPDVRPATTVVQSSAPGVFSDAALAAEVASLDPTTSAASDDAYASAQRFFRRSRRGRRATAMTALLVGSAAAITGGALLAYANRPECDTNAAANGCGYGFKVLGGSVLAGGVVGVTLGALMWPR